MGRGATYAAPPGLGAERPGQSMAEAVPRARRVWGRPKTEPAAAEANNDVEVQLTEDWHDVVVERVKESWSAGLDVKVIDRNGDDLELTREEDDEPELSYIPDPG